MAPEVTPLNDADAQAIAMEHGPARAWETVEVVLALAEARL